MEGREEGEREWRQREERAGKSGKESEREGDKERSKD